MAESDMLSVIMKRLQVVLSYIDQNCTNAMEACENVQRAIADAKKEVERLAAIGEAFRTAIPKTEEDT